MFELDRKLKEPDYRKDVIKMCLMNCRAIEPKGVAITALKVNGKFEIVFFSCFI